MGRRSSLSQLEASVQAEVQRLIRDGWTIDGITAELAKLGAPMSRSAVGRYVQHARKSMETYAQAQEVSRVWLDRLDTEPNGDVARLLPEMLRAVAFSTVNRMVEDGEEVKPMDLMLLTKSVKDLAGTTKDLFAIAKLRAEAAANARALLLEEQRAKLDAMPTKGGVTAETKAAIREALGIV